MEDIRRQIDDDLRRGTVAYSREEALAKSGGKLAVAALGAVSKDHGSAAVRIIHDATHKVEVNHCIRVRDQVRFPRIDDLEGVLRQLGQECLLAPGLRFELKCDVSRAHKPFPIREEDSRFQAFSLDDPDIMYMHTMRAFGSASAAFHWQRVAAALVRVSHYLAEFAQALYHLLYADDGLLLPAGRDFWRRACSGCMFWSCWKCPLSWKEVARGTSLCWIGHQLDVSKFEKGIGPSKVQWLGRWIGE